MTVQRVIWIIVGVLLLAVVFMGGVVFATLGARRMNVAGMSTRAAMARGNVPSHFRAQPNGRQGVAPNTRMMPFSRGNANPGRRNVAPNRMMPNNRGRQNVAPNWMMPNNRGRRNITPNPPTPPQNVPPSNRNRLPRTAQ